MPKSAAEVAELAIGIKNDPASFIDENGSWDSDLTVESVEWFEENNQ